jgi:hypothetical protein
MSFKALGSRIEYLQAAKRLEEIANAPAGTAQARERKELIGLFREFERDLLKLKASPLTRKGKA